MRKMLKSTQLLVLFLFASNVYAEPYIDLNLSVDQRFMEVFRFNVGNVPEESLSMGAGISAFRRLSDSSSLGIGLEYFVPQNRELEDGSGKIIGFKLADYRKRINDKYAIEYFFGFAQYDWIKTASGYYGGLIGHYHPNPKSPWSIGLALRHYEGLTHDGGPGGDQFVNGQTVSFEVHYKVKTAP